MDWSALSTAAQDHLVSQHSIRPLLSQLAVFPSQIGTNGRDSLVFPLASSLRCGRCAELENFEQSPPLTTLHKVIAKGLDAYFWLLVIIGSCVEFGRIECGRENYSQNTVAERSNFFPKGCRWFSLCHGKLLIQPCYGLRVIRHPSPVQISQ